MQGRRFGCWVLLPVVVAMAACSAPAREVAPAEPPESAAGQPVDPALPAIQRLADEGICSVRSGQVTGHTFFDHPTWGRSVFVSCLDQRPGLDDVWPDPEPTQGLAVVGHDGTVRWSYKIPGSLYYILSLPTPGADASGNLFVLYDPGRHYGVAVFRPASDSMTRLAGFYSSDVGDGEDSRFYHAELVGPDAAGVYSILHHVDGATYAWNGYDYSVA